jgi:hypothetical protein
MKSWSPQQLVVWRTSTQLASLVQPFSNVGKVGSGPVQRTAPESGGATPPSTVMTPESELDPPPEPNMPPFEVPELPPAGLEPVPFTPPELLPPDALAPPVPDLPAEAAAPPVFDELPPLDEPP